MLNNFNTKNINLSAATAAHYICMEITERNLAYELLTDAFMERDKNKSISIYACNDDFCDEIKQIIVKWGVDVDSFEKCTYSARLLNSPLTGNMCMPLCGVKMDSKTSILITLEGKEVFASVIDSKDLHTYIGPLSTRSVAGQELDDDYDDDEYM